MKDLKETLEAAGVGNAVFLLQFLEISKKKKRHIMDWFGQRNIELELVNFPATEIYSAKFSSTDDPVIKAWTEEWENEDGSSQDPVAYRMIQVNVTDQ